jgi:transcriptional regulator with XRE-family HTH domain
MTDWPAMLEELRQAGVTQAYIAQYVGMTESAVGQLKRGLISEPKYSRGVLIIELHAEICDSRETENISVIP